MASVWAELKRRNVVRVAAAYAVVGWLLIEVAATIFPIFEAPQWVLQTLTFVVILGFPLALVLSWMFDLTPSGVEKTGAESEPREVVSQKSRRLDFAIIGALVIALGFVIYNYVLNLPPANSIVGDERPSIAALPFSNESASEENAEFLANGIHDELLTQLAKISALKVISRTSVMDYRDSPKNIRQIGQELGVTTLLEGRVQRVGDMVRVNVQLIDAETDESLWAEIYNREISAENIFAIQTEMATAIAGALQATLSPQEVARLNEMPTQSTRAYNLYLTGIDFARRASESEYMPRAIEMYEAAVQEDPEFALAWAALAQAHSELSFGVGVYDPDDPGLRAAEQSIQRALALAPNSPEAHLALGNYYYFGFLDYDRALEAIAMAEQGLPGDARVFSAKSGVYRRAGDWELSLANRERAIELDPRNPDTLYVAGTTYLALRDYARAEQFMDRVLEITPDSSNALQRKAEIPLFRDGDVAVVKELVESRPEDFDAFGQNLRLAWTAAIYERDYAAALAYLEASEVDSWFDTPIASLYGVSYALARESELAHEQFQSARNWLEERYGTSPENPYQLLSLGEVMVGLGQADVAVGMAQRAMELMPPSTDAYAGPLVQKDAVTRILAPAGAATEAIEILDAILANRAGSWSIEGLSPDPRLDPIRDDPRFQALVEEYSRQ